MTAGRSPVSQTTFDLRSLFQPGTLAPAEIQRWISRQQPPGSGCGSHYRRVAHEVLASQWRHLLDRLAVGLIVEKSTTTLSLGIAGVAFISLDRSTSEISAHVVSADGEETQAIIELGTPLPGTHWVRHVLAANGAGRGECWNALFAARIMHASGGEDHHSAVDSAVRALVDWSTGCVIRRMQRTFDFRTLRSKVREALSLDPRLLELARRTKFDRRVDFDVSSRLWNLCAQHRAQLEEAARLAPALLPVLGEVIARNPLPSKPAMRLLQDEVRRCGGTPADWRWLLRARPGPVTRMLRHDMLSESDDLAHHFVAWAAAHRGLPRGVRWRPSMWMALSRIAVAARDDEVDVPESGQLPVRLVSEAIAAAARAEAAGKYPVWLDQLWRPFVRWFANYDDTRGPLRVTTWQGALRRVRADARRAMAVASAHDGEDWAFRLTRYRNARYRAVALDTPASVVEEALQMHHCADRFIPDCRQGRLRLFHICGADDGRSIATLALRARPAFPPWEVAELKGPANQPVGPGVNAFAQSLARAWNRQVELDDGQQDRPGETEDDMISRTLEEIQERPAPTLRVLWIDGDRILTDPYADCPRIPTRAGLNGWDLDSAAGRAEALKAFRRAKRWDIDADYPNEQGFSETARAVLWARAQAWPEELPPATRLVTDARYRAGIELQSFVESEMGDRPDLNRFEHLAASPHDGRPPAVRYLGSVPALNRELVQRTADIVIVDERDPDPAIERLIATTCGMGSMEFRDYMAVAMPIRIGRLRPSTSR